MKKPSSTQSGSVFFIIFFAIALFAAVSYAVFQGSRSGGSTLTKEQSRLAAQEIISFADSVGTGVNKLRLSGCTEAQLNFENIPTGATFDNAGAPSDGSCDVFSLSGGSINYASVPSNYGSSADYYFNSQTIIQGSGTVANDLTLWLKNLNADVCREINLMINGVAPTTEAVGTHTQPFTGSYGSTIAGGVGDDGGSAYANKSSGCILQGGTASNYYRVLVAR